MDAMQGHLDHETAHVVYTDFSVLKKLKRKDKKLFLVVNALEDPRIEKKFIELWPGSRVNLGRSLEWALEKVSVERELEDPENPGQTKLMRPWDGLSDFGKLTYAAAVWPQLAFRKDHWFMEDVVDVEIKDRVYACEDLLREATNADSIDDVIPLAKSFMDRCNEEEDPTNYVDPDDINDEDTVLPPQGKGADRSSMYKQPKRGQKSGGPQTYQGELADEDEEDENLPKAPGLSDEDVAEDSNGQHEPPDEDEEGGYDSEEGDEDDEDSSHGGAQRQGGGEGPDYHEGGGGARRPDFDGVTDEELDRDIDMTNRHEFIREAAAKEFDGTDRYLVYSTEGDIIEQIKDGDRVRYKKFMLDATGLVSTIKRKMSRSLLATNVSRWEGDKNRGMINPRAVFRVPLGTSKRVFRQKVESEDYNTAVQIMVDHSGSMSGSKLDLAAKTSIILAEVLNMLSVPFSICGFSTGDWDAGSTRFRAAGEEERGMYTRWGDLWIGLYKDFNESWSSSNHRIINMVRNERANTYDGESLRWGCNRLLNRPEQRKILFWLNDGSPCPNGADDMTAHQEYARQCAQEVEKLVELMAFGVKTDAVKRYYKNYVVVNDIKDLPTVCLNELDALLRKGKSLRAA
jgi:cobalamin biosynthesis protein CobT